MLYELRTSRWLCRLFEIAWYRRLGFEERWGAKRVVRIDGWRSALVDHVGGSRMRVTFLFGSEG